MGIKIVAKVEHHFDEEAREWEATMAPTLVQSFEGYYTCPEHGTLHEDDLTDFEQGDQTSGRCPRCNGVVLHKEDTVIDLGATEYLASSVCEVNSAIETNLLILQRRYEEEGENLRQAEEDRRNKTMTITRVTGEEQSENGDQEPEAG